MMIKKYDLTGKTIHGFYVIEDSGQRRQPCGNKLWRVRCPYCQCEKLYTRHLMESCKSCGCYTKYNKTHRHACWKGVGEMSKSYYNTVCRNAKQRGLEFNISMQDIWDLYLKQGRKCALTGEQIVFPTHFVSHDGTASLDRIDSTKGYVIDNVQWVHKIVNFMKQQFNQEDFINWCKKVVNYNN